MSRSLKLYTPEEDHACSYLPEKRARSSYVDPKAQLDLEWLTQLNLQGFRRSGRLIYRPQCDGCDACISTRILADEVKLSRSQKRILSRNRDLTLSVIPAHRSGGFYDTYQRYINQRHSDGDMYPPSMEQYQDFLMASFGNTFFLCVHHQQKFVGALVFDVLQDGLSSVYCFFEPEYSERSVGGFLILRLTQLAQWLGRPYNYLGYTVDDCQKMAYKRQFKPQQHWRDDQWQ